MFQNFLIDFLLSTQMTFISVPASLSFTSLPLLNSPTKADFIRAKHQMLSFVYRPSREDVSEDGDVSRQLHSSVRTSNLETSLRLLSQGADPNYYHKVMLNLASLSVSDVDRSAYVHVHMCTNLHMNNQIYVHINT